MELNKLLLLFCMDELNWSKVMIKTFMLQKIFQFQINAVLKLCMVIYVSSILILLHYIILLHV